MMHKFCLICTFIVFIVMVMKCKLFLLKLFKELWFILTNVNEQISCVFHLFIKLINLFFFIDYFINLLYTRLLSFLLSPFIWSNITHITMNKIILFTIAFV